MKTWISIHASVDVQKAKEPIMQSVIKSRKTILTKVPSFQIHIQLINLNMNRPVVVIWKHGLHCICNQKRGSKMTKKCINLKGLPFYVPLFLNEYDICLVKTFTYVLSRAGNEKADLHNTTGWHLRFINSKTKTLQLWQSFN